MLERLADLVQVILVILVVFGPLVWLLRGITGPLYDGCECPSCERERLRHRAAAVGDHECQFNGGEEWPEHCVICGLAVNDPRRHKFLRVFVGGHR